MIEITSRENKLFKVWRSLLQSRGIQDAQKALIFGQKAGHEMMARHPEQISNVILPSSMSEEKVEGFNRFQTTLLTPALFNELDVFGTKRPIFIVDVPPFARWMRSRRGRYLLLALQDPGNLGTVIRSAASFGFSKIILAEECAHPFHPRSSRAASGQLFNVEFLQGPPLKDFDSDMPVLVLDMHGTAVSEFSWPSEFILSAGLEGPGVPPTLCAAAKIKIPMQACVESLNAATALSIAMHQAYEASKNCTAGK